MSKKLRFAVIGTGFWSTLQIPAWRGYKNVELTALYNRTYEKAVIAGKNYGIDKVYADAEKMIAEEKPDFIDIITEVPAHEEFVLLAAKHKVDVVCQKPMSTDYASCEKMVKACMDNGVRLIIHENYRWQEHFRTVKKILDSGAVGKIRRAEFNYYNRGRATFANQPFLKTLPHLITTDFGSHMFDLIRYFYGEPESVYCRGLKTYEELSGEDSLVATLRYPDMLCTCAVSENTHNAMIFVDGESGTLEMDKENNITLCNEEGVRKYEKPVYPTYEWASHVYGYLPPECVSSIVDCNGSVYESLANNTVHETEGIENLKTMKIVYAACESIENNTVVSLL